MPNPIYAGPEWKALRLQILQRDGHRCQIKGPKCKGRATHVDHIVDVLDGGARLDPRNLRAACGSCNIAKRNTTVAARARAYRNGESMDTPTPASSTTSTPRWWRWCGDRYWEPISSRFADADYGDVYAVEPPRTGPGTP